jgi:zinc finger HIT domain-containing protein 1
MAIVKGKTPAVKKILLSQKTFAYHLSDEEAWQTQQPPHPLSSSNTAPKAATSTPASTAATPAPSSRPSKAPKNRRSMPSQDVDMADAPPASDSANAEGESEKKEEEPKHPLLVQKDALAMPSAEELEALFDAPMLSYVAAKVDRPGPNDPPPRKFCEMCGYWGSVRCMKCGARVCGLECRLKHDESRCQRFFG